MKIRNAEAGVGMRVGWWSLGDGPGCPILETFKSSSVQLNTCARDHLEEEKRPEVSPNEPARTSGLTSL